MTSLPVVARLRERREVTFAILAIAASSFALLQSLILPVLSQIQAEFDTDQATVTWVLTGYLLSASICTPLLGRVGDVVGKQRMLVIVLGVLSLGSLAAALAPSIGWLIAARVVQGAGGGVLPLSFGIIRDEFREQTALAISVIASLTAVGLGLGIVLAGPLIEAFGFHGLFWVPLAATSLATLGALLFVPESPVRTPSRLPVLPAVLLAGWLVALLLGLSKGNQWGWASAKVLGLLVVAVLLVVAWVTSEMRAPVPMIDMHMMRRRGVWTTNVVAACLGFGMYAAISFLPQLVQTPAVAGYGFGASVTESGHLILPYAIASFLVGFTTARLVQGLGARAVISVGLLLGGLAFTSIALWHAHTWQLYAATTLQGIGTGLVFSSLATVVIGSVPAEQTGVASGMNANIRTIGGSIGSAVMAGIVTSQVGLGGFPAERGYEIGFLVLAAVMTLAILAALRIPDLRNSTAGTAQLDDTDNAELGAIAGSPTVPAYRQV